MPVPPPPPPAPTVRPTDRYSVAAILSVVALIVPLFGPLVAIVLATGALARIRRGESGNSPRLRGKRLAYAGLGFGAALLVAEYALVASFQRSTTEYVDAQVAQQSRDLFAVTNTIEADAALVRWSVSPQDRITRDQLLQFAQAARQRYGEFRSISIVASDTPDFTLTRQAVSTAVAFRFEKGDRMGSIVTVLEPDPTAILRPRPRLAEVNVDDRALGTLRLGPSFERTDVDEARGNGGGDAG